MSSETPENMPANTDLDHGKEGHHFPKVLVLGWLVFIGWLVAYVTMNIGQTWDKW